ncbi:MAG: TonB-dependent receptor, partial [Porticoccaceae bacterium]
MNYQFNNNTTKAFKKKITCILLTATAYAPIGAYAALEEIIVTANKRAENANDIGLSIAAVSGEKLAEQKLTSLEEITSVVPGLVFTTSQQNTPILTLRGVGFNESSLGVYPATSIYVDEVPLPFPVMAAHSAYDLERVEVLKGPQGVLFGQNSTGGAINFIAAKPTEELSYGADLSYGRFDKIETNAFISGALSEKVGARLAVQNVQADEWQKSVTRDDENGKEDYTAGRLLLNFQPTEASEVSVNINGWRDKSDPQAFQFVAASPKRFDLAPDVAALQVAAPYAEENPRSADWSPITDPSGDREFFQGSVRGDFDLTDSLTLTALASHSEFEQDQRQDGDGSHLVTGDFVFNKGEIESSIAEIRLASDDGSALRWLAGVNYEDSSTFENQLYQHTDNTNYRPSALYISRSGLELAQSIESYAVFGNIDYQITQDLTFKLGGRYTDTTIDANGCTIAAQNAPGAIDASGGSGANFARLFNILGARSGRAFDPIGLGDCYTLDEDAAPADPSQVVPGVVYGVPGIEYVNSLGEDNVSWRAGVDYRWNEDTLIYANISQGYKAGSYPTLAASTHNQFKPVTQESVLA